MDLDRNRGRGRTAIHELVDGRCDEVSLSTVSPQRRSAHSRIRSDRGASALEFGLVIPVLLLLLFGIVEFGIVFQHQLALTHAAREGARMASVGTWDVDTVKATAFPIVPTVTVTPDPPDSALRGETITVRLTYVYDWLLVPIPGTVELKGQAVMRRE